jgi:hypothetical protein
MTWRVELNQLAVDFWCGVGDVHELSRWADAANEATGEVHPDVWDIYTSQTYEAVEQLVLKIAYHCNQFEPTALNAEPHAIKTCQKAIQLLLMHSLSTERFCDVINLLDTNFVTIVRSSASPYPNWLGNLWNCCDWYEECSASALQKQAIADEAARVLETLNSISSMQAN